MQKEMLEIRHSIFLISIFKNVLQCGITRGIDKEKYFSLVNQFVFSMNEGGLGARNQTIFFDDITFEEVVKKANKELEQEVFELNTHSNSLIATVNYSKNSLLSFYIGLSPRHRNCLEALVLNNFPRYRFPLHATEKAKVEDLKNAEKIAAFFINDILDRYLDSRVKKNRWPEQCKDIDKYIIEKDLANTICEYGTRKAVQLAYTHALAVTCDLIKRNPKILWISNDPARPLAYANFLKFFECSRLSFLSHYYHRNLADDDLSLTIALSDNGLSYENWQRISSDYYGEDDEYRCHTGQISNRQVEIMKKRLTLL